MRFILLIFSICLLVGCSKPKTVLICGDHVCINKAEAEKYFEENLSIEVKIVQRKNKKNFDLVELNMQKDNSGAKKARCIQVHKKPKRGVAFIADKMTASVQQLTSNNVKLKKGQLCQVLVLTTKKVENRFDGSSSSFDLNSGIVLDPNGKPIMSEDRRTQTQSNFNYEF